jgi:hypothetical protein
MRHVIALAAVSAVLLVTIAAEASAAPPNDGCGAEASVWTKISYVTVPSEDWMATSLYTWSKSETRVLEAWIEDFGGTEEEFYFGFVDFFETVVDKNNDDAACVLWLGANPGQVDWLVNGIDNHANAQT